IQNCGTCGNTCSQSCSNGVLSQPVCNAGQCGTQNPQACPNGFGCSDSTTCTGTCGGPGDCQSTHYCNSGQCVTKKLQGVACSTAGECATGSCVDGVCCDTAC